MQAMKHTSEWLGNPEETSPESSISGPTERTDALKNMMQHLAQHLHRNCHFYHPQTKFGGRRRAWQGGAVHA